MVSSIIVESVRDSGIHVCGFLYLFEYNGDYFGVNARVFMQDIYVYPTKYSQAVIIVVMFRWVRSESGLQIGPLRRCVWA